MQESYSYELSTSKSPEEVFNILCDIGAWWSGLYGETITGNADGLYEDFIFEAGGGMHYSRQQLIEYMPGKKIAWKVTNSKLTFAAITDEWTGTEIHFDIIPVNGTTKIVFTHQGLSPAFGCYANCSAGWTSYLEKLQDKLNEKN